MQVIREGFQLIYAMNLQLPTRFVLLDKAIATLGSVGVELYRTSTCSRSRKPYARSLLRERLTPRPRARGAGELIEARARSPRSSRTSCTT